MSAEPDDTRPGCLFMLLGFQLLSWPAFASLWLFGEGVSGRAVAIDSAATGVVVALLLVQWAWRRWLKRKG